MSSVDVIPLGDTRRHCVPEGYKDRNVARWLVLQRRIEGLFPPCWCNPTVEPVFGSDDQLGAIYVHCAQDGREDAEQEAA